MEIFYFKQFKLSTKQKKYINDPVGLSPLPKLKAAAANEVRMVNKIRQAIILH